jgi:glycosyltransferase involved in cell wall biosynthesis
MSFRFQRLSSTPRGYIKWFYARQSALADQPYDQQHAALMIDGAERGDSYSAALGKLGYTTEELVGDAEPMQKRWALEHGVAYAEKTWMADIALAQIRAFRPQVLLLSSWLEPFGPDFVKRCREECPSIRLVMGRVGETRPRADLFRAHDFVLSCAPDTVDYFRAQGVPSRHLDHGFDPRILERVQVSYEKNVHVGFVGHLTFGDLYHNNRVRLFYDIAQLMDFTIYGLMSGVVYQPGGIKRALRLGYYAWLETLQRVRLGRLARLMPRYTVWQQVVRPREPYVPLYAFLESRLAPPVYGLEMYRVLSTFKLCLNAHGPSAYASNMRLYEATGVGTCLLTDWKDNLPQLFEPETEVVTYRSPAEAVEKARYLLDHDEQRQAIAAAGQRRTLRDHTIAQRAEKLHEYITEFMRAK